MITTVIGDLITVAEGGGYTAVLHNCNCFNTMGAGVAKAIAQTWPEALQADAKTKSGDMAKLGTFSSAVVTRGSTTFTVYNLYGQYRYGTRRDANFDIDALTNALHMLDDHFAAKGTRESILFPLMGTGHAGGRWRYIAPILSSILCSHKLTLVKLP